ncbi:HAD family hydrolase [Microvirga guangxiensis]|uniref:Haloacid dehalogenase superfamily, subfamily IA, variant 3 with third motif having DD or ED/haloacid dehalogenase superfamily, subfamily IA, variant 1 with third motif having Dx(3-4)D or Dx(3-4)E n=1 Tax=Microvirga guangxiensis TaxID=549386 RepID=A0A1G5GEX1_9HYPH|nr:HAD family hydrolase [Microvirga guangxiensis]SCY50103.1 haloacid dehalogenase superfamily, subfamily IA, variant 3 with third motif having DD or ED/haloacid dehalogenase superfamily, subfamily IA, variant 1 with third motif having Dx(3-4)D or Dx(3-4)E [Microvirga guangxiensis]
MTKAIIFDVDGTLVDTVDLHASAWVEALKQFGIDIAFKDMRAQIGKGGDQILQGLVPPDVLKEKQEEIEAFRADLFKREYLPRARPFPGVRALFEHIRASGQSAVLASSGKEDEVEGYKKLADIADLVDSATSSDDAERSKPFPDIFQAALEKLAPLGADDAVVVGDTPYDAEAARNAGLKTVGVLSGGFSEQALREAGCIAIYRDPEDLLRNYASSPLAPS